MAVFDSVELASLAIFMPWIVKIVPGMFGFNK
ncbi:unnamed protein product, partial [Allacma fusca]